MNDLEMKRRMELRRFLFSKDDIEKIFSLEIMGMELILNKESFTIDLTLTPGQIVILKRGTNPMIDQKRFSYIERREIIGLSLKETERLQAYKKKEIILDLSITNKKREYKDLDSQLVIHIIRKLYEGIERFTRE